MKSNVLHTVWCSISGEATGETWNWSLLGGRGWKVHERHRNFLLYPRGDNTGFEWVEFKQGFVMDSGIDPLSTDVQPIRGWLNLWLIYTFNSIITLTSSRTPAIQESLLNQPALERTGTDDQHNDSDSSRPVDATTEDCLAMRSMGRYSCFAVWTPAWILRTLQRADEARTRDVHEQDGVVPRTPTRHARDFPGKVPRHAV